MVEEIQEWAVGIVSSSLLFVMLVKFVQEAKEITGEQGDHVLNEIMSTILFYQSLPLDQIEFWIILMGVLGGGGFLFASRGRGGTV
jgi:hypothetical protein